MFIAILDLTSSVVGTLVGSGIASAVNRYRFEATTEADQDAVWPLLAASASGFQWSTPNSSVSRTLTTSGPR